MGINGLWTLVKPALRQETMLKFTLEKGFQANPHGDHMLRLGIDASIWLNQAQATTLHRSYNRGQNPELLQLFHRMCNLLKFLLIPVFVFDGPQREAVKRNTNVSTDEHILTEPFENLINVFGFYHHTAPGEAEADLAGLNCAGHIDVVMTDDSDVLVFGAKSIMRNPNIAEYGDYVHMYTSETIGAQPVGLTPGGLLLIALLSGGDYHPGVKGCGIKTSYALARAGYGDSLLHILEGASPVNLPHALTRWNTSICSELRHNESGFLSQCCPSLAASFPADFPDLKVVRLYLKPVTSPLPLASNWVSRDADIGALGRLCEKHFSWGSAVEVGPRFCQYVLEGFVRRAMYQPHLILAPSEYLVVYDNNTLSTSGPLNSCPIVRITRVKSVAEVAMFVVRISTTRFTELALAKMYRDRRARKRAKTVAAVEFHDITIPVTVMELAFPDVVHNYRQGTKKPRFTTKRTSKKAEHPTTVVPPEDVVDDVNMPRTFLDDVFDQVMAVKRHKKPTPKPVDACPAAGPSTSRGVGTRR
ncbi:hypothetical protein HGRIS_003096 [Hohenbuehelia grisea]|uniref:XPG-I domain-containing protein n=1 Tax=Hohenbuehelia grisea TaxID=104357 RepID=A0ABR3JPK2_9AGAR